MDILQLLSTCTKMISNGFKFKVILPMQLNLGFHYHVPVDVSRNFCLMPGYLGVFLDELAQQFNQIIYFAHTMTERDNFQMDYQIKASNFQVVDIGPHYSVIKRYTRQRSITRIVKSHLGSIDILFIRGPSPLLPVVANAARSKPTVLLLVGDYVAGIDGLPQPGWRKELIRAGRAGIKFSSSRWQSAA